MLQERITQKIRDIFSGSGYKLNDDELHENFKEMSDEISNIVSELAPVISSIATVVAKEHSEQTLAEVIDTLYLERKAGFCGGKPHELGRFKEDVKSNFHRALNKKNE